MTQLLPPEDQPSGIGMIPANADDAIADVGEISMTNAWESPPAFAQGCPWPSEQRSKPVLSPSRLAHSGSKVTQLQSTTVDGGPHNRRSGLVAYSHSMVPGGLLVTSSTTRFTSGTSLVIRVEILASTSYGTRVQSAVIASSEETGRSTTG
jgi:hypothetical protein